MRHWSPRQESASYRSTSRDWSRHPRCRNPNDVENCSISPPEPHAIVTPPDDRWPMTDDLAGEVAISHESG